MDSNNIFGLCVSLQIIEFYFLNLQKIVKYKKLETIKLKAHDFMPSATTLCILLHKYFQLKYSDIFSIRVF